MTRSLVWGTSLIILLGAAVLAGRASQPPPSGAGRPAGVTGALGAGPERELARCRTAPQGDLACRAAWAAARERFFGRPAS